MGLNDVDDEVGVWLLPMVVRLVYGFCRLRNKSCDGLNDVAEFAYDMERLGQSTLVRETYARLVLCTYTSKKLTSTAMRKVSKHNKTITPTILSSID